MGADADGTAFLIGDWLVEPELNRIVRGGEIVKIDPRNMRLLQLLASRPRQVISQAEIEQAVWSDVVVTPNSVYQSIAQLRRALGDEKANPRYIETIARKGYRLVAKISYFGQPKDSQGNTSRSSISVLSESQARFSADRLTAIGLLGLLSILAAVAITHSFAWEQGSGSTASQTRGSSISIEDQLNFQYASIKAPESPHITSNVLEELAIVANNDGRAHEALAYAKEAAEFERRLSGDKSPETAARLATLAIAYHWLSQYELAEESARQAVAIYQRTTGLQPKKFDALDALGAILVDRGKFAEANMYIQEAIELSDQLYGKTSGQSTYARSSLLALHNAAGRHEDAEKLARWLLANQAVLRSYSIYEVMIRTELVSSLLQQQRYEESVLESQVTLHSISKTLRADHPYAASAHELLGMSLIGIGKHQQAEQALRRAMAIWGDAGGWTWRVGRSASVLGEALLGQGRISEAEKYLTYASRALEGASSGQLELRAIRDHELRLEQLRAAVDAQRSSFPTGITERAPFLKTNVVD